MSRAPTWADLAVVIADTPKFMMEGDWRLGIVIDDGASEEQAEKLGAVFGGEAADRWTRWARSSARSSASSVTHRGA